MAESPKFPRLEGNRGRGTRFGRLHFDRKWKYGRFAQIVAAEHDGDVRFISGSGNMAILCTRNASSHNYRNSKFFHCGRGYGVDSTFYRTYF